MLTRTRNIGGTVVQPVHDGAVVDPERRRQFSAIAADVGNQAAREARLVTDTFRQRCLVRASGEDSHHEDLHDQTKSSHSLSPVCTVEWHLLKRVW